MSQSSNLKCCLTVKHKLSKKLCRICRYICITLIFGYSMLWIFISLLQFYKHIQDVTIEGKLRCAYPIRLHVLYYIPQKMIKKNILMIVRILEKYVDVLQSIHTISLLISFLYITVMLHSSVCYLVKKYVTIRDILFYLVSNRRSKLVHVLWIFCFNLSLKSCTHRWQWTPEVVKWQWLYSGWTKTNKIQRIKNNFQYIREI